MKRAKKVSILLLISQFMGISLLFGQQQPQISNYMFNTMFYNPAYAGLHNAISATALHRQQWYGFEGAPQTTHVSIDAPVRAINSGIGLVITNDQIGIQNNSSIDLAFNYKLSLGEGTLGIGVQGGLSNIGITATDMKAGIGEDYVIKDKESVSEFLFNLSAGLYYQVQDKYEIGLSMTDINAAKSDYLNYQRYRSLNLSGNYLFHLAAFPNIDFVPSTLIKTDFTSFQVDLSLVGVYNNQFFGGLSYRLKDAVVLHAGLFFKDMQIGVAYDMATSWMFKAGKIGGGFEVFLKYNFNLSVDRLPRSYKNSRYL